MVESLEIGICKYELGIFLNNEIVDVFRTDSEQCQSIMIEEATREIKYLQIKYPNRIYRLDSIPKDFRIKNVGLIDSYC